MMNKLILLSLILISGCNCTTAEHEISKMEGSIRSVSGVMDILSCHCGEGAYLNNNKALCFDDTGKVPECTNIYAEAYQQSSELKETADNPCPSGRLEIFQVVKYTCIK